ncbi:MAG: TIGR02757 family protein [Opitutae bacterium]|nr:TIGR02757 family protein [Opitutae bacterium]
MNEMQKKKLAEWAQKFHTKEFVAGDPVSFPHRYSRRDDIEISGFLTAFLSFGNRAQILKAAEKLDAGMRGSPSEYLRSRRWEKDFAAGDPACFYRMISRGKMHDLFRQIFGIFDGCGNLENAVVAERNRRQEAATTNPDSTTNPPATISPATTNPMACLCGVLGVSAQSPQKKLNMFLRWMIRRNSPVDFGIWQSFSPAELIIPLDTHVLHVAQQLGLTTSLSYSLSTAKKITAALAEIFPNDPCLGDFALFGAGVNGDNKAAQ